MGGGAARRHDMDPLLNRCQQVPHAPPHALVSALRASVGRLAFPAVRPARPRRGRLPRQGDAHRASTQRTMCRLSAGTATDGRTAGYAAAAASSSSAAAAAAESVAFSYSRKHREQRGRIVRGSLMKAEFASCGNCGQFLTNLWLARRVLE